MTKTLVVLLKFTPVEAENLTFRMEVPVNVFSQGELIIPAPTSDGHDLYMHAVLFRPRTDGMVEVKGFTGSHDLMDALGFLARHPDVSEIRRIPRA